MGITAVGRRALASCATVLFAVAAGACGSSHSSGASSSSTSEKSPAATAPTATDARAAAPRPGRRYVALGSSFAAGPGIPAQLGGLCARSDHNYPHLLAARLHLDVDDVS